MLYERQIDPDGAVYESFEGTVEEISKLKILIDNELMELNYNGNIEININGTVEPEGIDLEEFKERYLKF